MIMSVTATHLSNDSRLSRENDWCVECTWRRRVCSAGNLHWSEPAQVVRAVVGDVDHDGIHSLSPHHWTAARDPWLPQRPQAETYVHNTTDSTHFMTGPFLPSSSVFSKRELTFMFTICCRPSVCRLSSALCLLSVTFVSPTQAVQIFGNISTALGTLAIIHWHPLIISRRSSQGNPSAAISDLSTAVSLKQCKIGGKLVLITNRKSYMSFRLVPKSVIFNDLERRNGVILRYFIKFG